MDEACLERLAAGIRLHGSSRTRRLFSLRLGMSRWIFLQKLSLWRMRSMRINARTFWGDPMSVLYPDGVSVELYRYGYFEAGLTRIFLSYLKAGMTLFDIGAHFGYFTLLGSRLVGDSGQVHSFEPTPGTFEILRANAGSRANVRLNQMAVFSHESTLSLTGYEQFPSYNTLGRGNVGDAYEDKLKKTTY